jgi:O-antigen ligase/tetratricopeptide (TPR) repeat protein
VFYVLSDGWVWRRQQIEAAFMVAALAAAGKALWIVGGDYLEWLRLTRDVQGGLSVSDLVPPTVPEVHNVGDFRNYLGVTLTMSFPFFLAMACRPSKWPVRLLSLAGALAVLLAIFFTLTRSTWLGAALAGVTTLALLTLITDGGRQLLRRLRPETTTQRWLAGVALVAVVALAIVAALYLLQSIEARPYWLFRPSGGPRVDVLEAGAEMAQDYPFLGTGPGAYRLLYPEYSGRYSVHAVHSHNGFFQAAIDMGVVGVVAMVALTLAVCWLLVQGLRNARGPARFTIAACAGAYVGFATFSFLDAPNSFKGPLVALAAVSALLVLSHREAPGRQGAQVRWQSVLGWATAGARLAIPLLLAGLLITWGRIDAAHYYYSNALANAHAGRWAEAIDQAQRSVELDPEFAIYRLELGTIYGQAYLEGDSPNSLQRGISELQRAVELEPRNAFAYANLAALQAKAGQLDEARDSASRAILLGGRDSVLVLAAGTALEEGGWQDEAVAAYAQALFLEPDLGDSPFWSATPLRQERFGEVIARSALDTNPCALLGLPADRLQDGLPTRDEALAACRQRADANPGAPAASIAVADALIAEGKNAEARSYVDRVLAREPDNGPARTALGSWYAAQGQVQQARMEWLRASQLDQPEALVLLGDS